MTQAEIDQQRKDALNGLREARGITKAEYERRRRSIEARHANQLDQLARTSG